MSEAVRYESRGDVGVITLDRPDNRNSMTPELLDAFAVASRRAREDADIRVLVVTGTGACFSSGADFKSTLQRDGDHKEPHERSGSKTAARIQSTPAGSGCSPTRPSPP